MPGFEVGRRTLFWSGVLGLVALAFLFAFFGIEAPRRATPVLGTINDILIIPQLVLLAVAAVVLRGSSGLDWLGLAAVIAGAALTVVAQVLLVARVWTFNVNAEFTLPAAGLLGIWMAIASWRWSRHGRLPGRPAQFGIVAGLLSILAAIGEGLVVASGSSLNGIPFPPLYATVPLVLGGIAYVFGIPIWSVWAGRVLRA